MNLYLAYCAGRIAIWLKGAPLDGSKHDSSQTKLAQLTLNHIALEIHTDNEKQAKEISVTSTFCMSLREILAI